MYNIFEGNDDEKFQIAGLEQSLRMPSNTSRVFLFSNFIPSERRGIFCSFHERHLLNQIKQNLP